ncbi:MAG: lyase [Pseudomonadota bacterium]
MLPSTVIRFLTPTLLALCGVAWLSSATAEPIEIEEWLVPFEQSRPRDPFAESADSVWFVGQKTGYLARLDVATGNIEQVVLKDGSGPHNLIVADNGDVWYAGNRTRLIGRYVPGTGEIEEIPMPDEAARDPHTLIFDADQRHIWFTVQGGNMMGRLNLASRKVDLIPSRTERSRPYGIKLAPDGSIWVALFGTSKLAHIDPDTLSFKEIDLPRDSARPRRLEVLADGSVWYVDYAGGMLGRYLPDTGTFKEWQMPQGTGARPYGMASDNSGRVWMVATGVQPNEFTGFDPASETFFSVTPVDSGGGTIRHMHYHAPTGSVWFGTDTNYVGRARVEADIRPAPPTDLTL